MTYPDNEMRLFTAIDLPAGILENLSRLVSQLRPTARIKWSPPDNLHLTTKFIGEWPEDRLADLKAALAPLASRGPVAVEVRGLGFFPNPKSPRVFWAGVQAGPELAELARHTDRATAALGVPPENRPFSPHLTLARTKWSPPDNLHLTTKFIGEWPEDRLGDLKAALAPLGSRGPIAVEVRNLGFFPNPKSPRVFWAGVQAGPELAELARDTDRATAALGVPPENRPFSPHLTLARIKEPVPMDALRRAIESLPDTNFGSFTATAFYLYQSRLTPSGSVYTKLSEFTFG